MLTWLAASLLVQTIAASCECGYSTNTGQVWQFQILTNFSSGGNASRTLNNDWEVIEVVRGDITEITPYQVNYTASNVILPSNSSSTTALQLVASAYTGAAGGAVACGEIATLREDILFGSFRASYAVNGGAGAVSGFFSYANDTNENDIEILTKDGDDEVVFTNQGVDTSNSSVSQSLPNDALTTSTQLYRFDWTKDSVKYYVNNYFMTNITNNPSQAASRIFMNAWSNGDSFTGGPPVVDMAMSVNSMALYFNSSDAATVAQYTSACRAAGGAAVCSVDSSSIIYTSNASTSAAARTSAAASASRSVTSLASSIRLTAFSILLAVMSSLLFAWHSY